MTGMRSQGPTSSPDRSRLLSLALAVLGVYGSFLSWGVLQERVSTTQYMDPKDPEGQPKYFKQFIFLNLCQSLAAIVVAWLYLRFQGIPLGSQKMDLIGKFFTVAFLNSIASPFGYASLQYIDYPTMILGKSCKASGVNHCLLGS